MRALPALCCVLTLALGACATRPLPDGGRIERLPETGSQLPALTADEARRLDELNQTVLKEQEEARRREQAQDAARSAPPHPYGSREYYGSSHAWPYGGWYWSGSRWPWRRSPGWAWGFGLHGPW